MQFLLPLVFSALAHGALSDKPAAALRGTTLPTYEVSEHSAIFGHKLTNEQGGYIDRVHFSRSIEECVLACEKYQSCVGFVEVQEASSPFCVLKSSSKRVHLKPITDVATSVLGVGQYERFSMTTLNGGKNIGERVYYSEEEGVASCVASCDAEEKCVAIVESFEDTPPYCELKDSSKGMYRKPFTRVFVKPKPSSDGLADHGYRVYEGSAIFGSKLGERIYYSDNTQDVKFCVEKCNALKACVGVVEVRSKGPAYCVLKSDSRGIYRTSISKRVLLKPQGMHDGDLRRVRSLLLQTEAQAEAERSLARQRMKKAVEEEEEEGDDYSLAYSDDEEDESEDNALARFTHHGGNAIRGNSISLPNGGTRLYYGVTGKLECAEMCNSTPNCVAFVDNHQKSPPYCVLKQSVSTMYSKSSKDVWIK